MLHVRGNRLKSLKRFLSLLVGFFTIKAFSRGFLAAFGHQYPTVELWALSFSLYGSETRYLDGALANAASYRSIFPGWQMWVYFDSSVPVEVLEALRNNGVHLINMTGSNLNPMTWRFLIASDADVSRYCVRDIDSRLLFRDYAAVRSWTESSFQAHIIRDHPSHIVSYVKVPGGTWCAKHAAFPEMRRYLQAESKDTGYGADQNFLQKALWPVIQTITLQHVSFSCAKHENYQTMLPRVGLEHVGAVFVDGAMRESDLILIRKAIQNGEQC